MGRKKTIFTEELAQEICLRMSTGEMLKDICTGTMPSTRTVYTWRQERPDFAAAFDKARLDLLYTWQEEMVTLADDATADFMLVVKKSEVDPENNCWVKFDRRHVARAKQQIETRQWMMEKLLPQFAPKTNLAVTHKYADMDGEELVGELKAAFEQSGLTEEEFMGLLSGRTTLN